MDDSQFSWVFVAAGGRFPAGLFDDKGAAETWIAKNALTGVLTRYPRNEGAYDYATRCGLFRPKGEHQTTAKFIGTFSCAAFEHHHYEDGRRG